MNQTRIPTPQSSASIGEESIDLLVWMLRTMQRTRVFEEKTAELLERKEIRCPAHLYIGQEAAATGVCAALHQDDYVFGAHRSHGHYLAKGGDMQAMMAELLGKQTGCSKGRGGSMHLIATEVGILGTVPIVAATIPIAVGTALASQLRNDGRVAVSFFGDGATEEGVFHESLNLAAHRKLPVIFVCENNFYASHLELLERRKEDNILSSATAHGIPGVAVDGNDVQAVYRVTRGAVKVARQGEGPTLVECRTFRWRGHVGPAWDIDVGVTRKVELDAWIKKDPIPRLRQRLLERGMVQQEFDLISQEVEEEVAEAIRYARESPYPDPDELADFVFKEGTEDGGKQ